MFHCGFCDHTHLRFPEYDIVNNGTVPPDRFGGCNGCDECADISEAMADAEADAIA
jgi:hypothetical protein